MGISLESLLRKKKIHISIEPETNCVYIYIYIYIQVHIHACNWKVSFQSESERKYYTAYKNIVQNW